MDRFFDFFTANNYFWLFIVVIPIINAIIGWVTNILALKMTFYPLEFFGIWKPYIGWQGIIPMKSKKMAEMSVDIMTEDLVRIDEQFNRIDPDKLAEEMKPDLSAHSKKVINEMMSKEAPVVWSSIPNAAKEVIYREANKELPMVVKYLMEDLKEVIVQVLDLKKMTVDVFENDKQLLNRTFLEVGNKEFEFIEKSGFYFGFLFGCVQATIWGITTKMGVSWPWLLPVGGFIVGYMTNFLALKLIFNPVKPINIFGYKLQGMYIKRQPEISEAYAHIVSEEVVTTNNMFNVIFRGEKSDVVMDIGEKHIREAIETGLEGFETNSIMRRIINYFKNEKRVEKANAMREEVVTSFKGYLPTSFTKAFPFITKQLGLKETIRTKMAALPPDKFAGFLRPVFKEDEWKLILVGGVLGLGAGLLQMVMVGA